MPTRPDHYRGERPFDLIVTLYADAQPAPWGVEEIRYGFPDAELDPKDLDRLREIAAYAAQRWKTGDQVLTRCQAGLNRSGLVTALILLADGWQPHKTVEHLRARRSRRVLSNDDFRAVVFHGDGLGDQNLGAVRDVTV